MSHVCLSFNIFSVYSVGTFRLHGSIDRVSVVVYMCSKEEKDFVRNDWLVKEWVLHIALMEMCASQMCKEDFVDWV